MIVRRPEEENLDGIRLGDFAQPTPVTRGGRQEAGSLVAQAPFEQGRLRSRAARRLLTAFNAVRRLLLGAFTSRRGRLPVDRGVAMDLGEGVAPMTLLEEMGRRG